MILFFFFLRGCGRKVHFEWMSGGRKAAWLQFFVLFSSSLPLTQLVFKGFSLAEETCWAGRSFTSALMEKPPFCIFFYFTFCCCCCGWFCPPLRPPGTPPLPPVKPVCQRRCSDVVSYRISAASPYQTASRRRFSFQDGRMEATARNVFLWEQEKKIQNHKKWINIQSDEPLLKICLFWFPSQRLSVVRRWRVGNNQFDWRKKKVLQQRIRCLFIIFQQCLSKLHFCPEEK